MEKKSIKVSEQNNGKDVLLKVKDLKTHFFYHPGKSLKQLMV